MGTGLADAQAATLVNLSLANGGSGASTGMKMLLGSTVGTHASAMTQSSWTGYTTGGTACAFGSASGSGTVSATNTGTPSWTNGSGSSQTVEGIELWDEAGSPLRWWYGAWTGEPITLANGNTFAVASAAVSCAMAST